MYKVCPGPGRRSQAGCPSLRAQCLRRLHYPSRFVSSPPSLRPVASCLRRLHTTLPFPDSFRSIVFRGLPAAWSALKALKYISRLKSELFPRKKCILSTVANKTHTHRNSMRNIRSAHPDTPPRRTSITGKDFASLLCPIELQTHYRRNRPLARLNEHDCTFKESLYSTLPI